MRILFVTSEAYPLIKTGGLADVSGALPKAINQLPDFKGEISLLLPGYSAVLAKLSTLKIVAEVAVLNQSVKLLQGCMVDSGLTVFVIQNADLYERVGGPYNDANGNDWPDNPLRFGVLSRVASLLSAGKLLKNWQADVVHCNDWQTGLTPTYMRLLDKSPAKSIMSIHNLAFQGNCDFSWQSKLELPKSHFKIDGYEYFGQISFLKAGIYYADCLSTVSPNYAQEIQTEAFGFGLQGLLKTRADDLTGILNGIDATEWHPKTDVHLPKNYDLTVLKGKNIVKRELQAHLGLKIDGAAPLLGVVSRLTHQKGLDLLPQILPQLLELGCQLALLGSGDKLLEAQFNALEESYPAQVSVTIGYHEHLSHNIMAGADMFIMPSRFEPCGLNQLYGLAYGTPPVVSPVGGLADSVTDTNALTQKNKTANGFVLESVTATSLLVTIKRALAIFSDKKAWKQLQKNGMAQNLSWEISAEAYLALYQKALAKKQKVSFEVGTVNA